MQMKSKTRKNNPLHIELNPHKMIAQRVHLKEAPSEIEQTNNPEDRIVRDHHIRPSIAQLLQILLRMKRQEEDE